jgi:hypothetical protein
MIVYWEGACNRTRTRNGDSVEGKAYVEMVGYSRSHYNPDLASFLLGSALPTFVTTAVR